jgi:hypothetical protein
MPIRRKRRPLARFWIPLFSSVALSMFVVHGCELLNDCGVSGIWILPDALFLVFPLLYLRFAHGLPQVALTALAIDAFWPGPYGTRLVVYGIVMIAMLPLRARIRRENPVHIFWFAMLMNLLIFVGIWLATVFFGDRIAAVPLARIFGDGAASLFFVGLSAFWWMEVQRYLIRKVSGEDPADYTIG